ncbi:RNA polymerase sigma factor [Synoicihabitans lomoniglobus]|uniref:Sigma-70 family RNA polymerase sigma factor n=1 Tax=Synoicihabitans lomoniglobus TaxID=2909285 RepID=A0AAF0I3I1_9BACT|nr:sigma-70 family RNA polymerase sigma factor [Opitutaceae bacterium LMO-M01]WED65925.1 sigma-70 family RNA polymerase sigma factor [Opitutaceae bacterium LMO-M01]
MPTLDKPFDHAACLERVREGDQDAARDLVDSLYPQVVKIVRGRLPRWVAEEDLAQEVFLKMFTRLEQYRGDVPLPHWVSRIAVTTCIDHLRKQQRRPELRRADLSEEESDMLDVVTADTNAEQAGDALAARELLGKLLDQLSPDDRMVIQLLDLEQKSLIEVGDLLGWNTTLVKVRAFRARRKLQKLWQKLEAEEHV